MAISRLLAATDGSRGAGVAVGLAAAQAKRLNAELVVVAVIGEHSSDEAEERFDSARRHAEELCSASGVAYEWVPITSKSPVADAIVDAADERGVDLIVMGQRGLGAAGRFFLGSVSNKIVALSTGAVLVAVHSSKDDAGTVEGGRLQKIAVATDGSKDAQRVASLAGELAVSNSATLSAVHVVTPPPGWNKPSFPDSDAILEFAAKVSEESFDAVRMATKDLDVSYDEHELHGSIAGQLLDFTEANDIDLLCVGHRGLSHPGRFLMGSACAQLVQHATTNMLIGPVPE